MAGKGSRFAKAGYKTPKPFIDVCGKPMIQVVVDIQVIIVCPGQNELTARSA